MLSGGNSVSSTLAAAARTAVEQLGQAVVGLRPDHEVDLWRAVEQDAALGLRDAAGDPDQQVAAGCLPRRRSCCRRPSSE